MYSKILVALDGSESSLKGGDIAIELAQHLGSEILAAHIYDARIHTSRFQEMEPVLPGKYQDDDYLQQLRASHDGLIQEGFHTLSKGYMDQFIKKAVEKGIQVSPIHREGRNYKELIHIAQEQNVNLIIVGFCGLGKIGENYIGSTALRLLRLAPCDILMAHATSPGSALVDDEKSPILIGIDGSEEALAALRKAIHYARLFRKPLHLIAAYDPAFHTKVFKTMGHSLSPDRQEQIGLQKQEQLHDQIIDDGLGKLYDTFLDQALAHCQKVGADAQKHLLQGKAYKALIDQAQESHSPLIIVGRYGHQREDMIGIGSHSEATARLAQTNVLVTSALSASTNVTTAETEEELEWEAEALERFKRIPPFAQSMAKVAIENYVKERKGKTVTLQDFSNVAQHFGMGG